MKIISRILSFFVTIVIPFILIMTSIRILINPFFLDYEYNLQQFPADPYGFSKEDRLKWGKISMDYLVNNEPDDFLGTLRFEDGTAVYNAREVSHMLDVRNLVKSALKAWYILLIILGVIGLAAWKTGNLHELRKAVARGGWLTLGVIGLVITSTFIDFSSLFTAFHGLFFEGDTWLFFADDTLIRLYPLKLWSDAFIFMGIFTMAGAFLCIFAIGRLSRKK